MTASSTRRTPRARAVSRRLPLGLAAGALALLLAACSGSGAAPKAQEPSGPTAAAYLPLSGGDELSVPDRALPPPHLRGRATGPATTAPIELRAPADLAATDAQARADRAPPPAPKPIALDRSGPQIRVTWEALAVERERLANPRVRSNQHLSLASQQKVVLVNQGHVEAQAGYYGVTSRQNQGVAVAAIPERDMDLFLRGLEQRGFFRLARPTDAIAHLLDDENARGRITVERDGRSWTLLSMRGQGLNTSTRAIPALYSETKQSLMMLRNQVSCMSVVGVEGGVLTPR